MRERIDHTLRRIENEHHCEIALAVESGSRAWGFASTDSDYDVRFIYLRPQSWYLSIQENRRDVIELPIVDELDVNGWDLRKALQLLRKSNPPLLEWLQSPIVYMETNSIAARMRELIPLYYSARGSFFHYFHMAEGNLREYLRGDVVWVKKYFYVLRPVLAMRWIERGLGAVPTEFDQLVEGTVDDDDIRTAIAELLAQKRAGTELGKGPRIPVISNFVDAEMQRLRDVGGNQPVADAPVEPLNHLFRDALRNARVTEPRILHGMCASGCGQEISRPDALGLDTIIGNAITVQGGELWDIVRCKRCGLMVGCWPPSHRATVEL